MKYFSLSLTLNILFISSGFGAYLPTVDVSRGGISARAAFGEDISTSVSAIEKPVHKNTEKKIVSRQTVKNKKTIQNTIDVLQPNRPSSDLWAREIEKPLRMPRMDEIAVINSVDLLPEETLTAQPIKKERYASNKKVRKKISNEFKPEVKNEVLISQQEALKEIKLLREEVAKLSESQRKTEEEFARTRSINVQQPVVLEQEKIMAVTDTPTINIRREIVQRQNNNFKDNTITETPEPKITSVNEMNKMSPNELKKAFKKTYLSENKHLSTYQIDNRYDEISDISTTFEGFTATRDLSETDTGVRPLEIKISFLNGDSGLSRENYDLLSQTASIVVNNPKRAIQIAIPESATHTKDARKLAARRLTIIEQVLRDTGIAEQRIVPVLSQRDDNEFVLRIISGDMLESLNKQTRNMFGDNVSKKTYKSMSW